MSDRARAEVLIVGGGHAGLLLGGALAAAGVSVLLVERQPRSSIVEARSDGRTLALLAGSVALFRRLGAWSRVGPQTAAIERVAVADVAGGGHVQYDSAAHGGQPFGAGVEHVALRRSLLEAFVDHAGAASFLQGEVASLCRTGGAMHVTLTDGRVIETVVVVGADGRGSRVRELARIGVDRWAYDQQALTLILRHDRPHRGAVYEWLRPGGPLATLPLPGRRTGVTWVERPSEARRLAELPGSELVAAFDRATDGVLGRIELDSGPVVYPLGAQHARHYVAPRVALVGDAAHGVHPIHAQGFNMGVADVGALVDAIVTARQRGQDIGSGEALLPYARARRSDNAQRLWLTDGLVRIFTAELAPVRVARSFALNAIEHVPPLKRLAVKHGMQTG